MLAFLCTLACTLAPAVHGDNGDMTDPTRALPDGGVNFSHGGVRGVAAHAAAAGGGQAAPVFAPWVPRGARG